MYDIKPLISRIKAYAERAKISEATASYRVFGDGDRIARLKRGSSVTVKTAETAWKKLDMLEEQADASS